MLKEIFLTLQGEGKHAGRKAVFVRFAGCNLWSGRPEDRLKGAGACARWCDTDFVGGKRTESPVDIAMAMGIAWNIEDTRQKFCVLTGGEPMLQVDRKLLQELSAQGWTIAVETNGTRPIHSRTAKHIDHICVSPKLGSKVDNGITRVDELKVVLPGVYGKTEHDTGWTDEQLYELKMWAFERNCRSFIVVPQDSIVPKHIDVSLLRKNYRGDVEVRGVLHQHWKLAVENCVEFVHRYPVWRVGVQAHKTLELP